MPDLYNTHRGHLWSHMPRDYCYVCAGTGLIGQHRWHYDTKVGKVVPAPLEPCPPCGGTGKAKKDK